VWETAVCVGSVLFVNVICGALQVLPIVSIYFEVPNELVNYN